MHTNNDFVRKRHSDQLDEQDSPNHTVAGCPAWIQLAWLVRRREFTEMFRLYIRPKALGSLQTLPLSLDRSAALCPITASHQPQG